MWFADRMDVLATFTKMVRKPESDINLARAAQLIARADQPGLDPAPSLAALDDFARDVSDLDGLCRRLFRELGFAGDRERYHAPENSLLNSVIERRLGMPITLSLVTLEVGLRAGMRLVPIGMPGHFLLRDPASGLYVDSFGGALLDDAGCEALFRHVTGAGPEVPFDESKRPAAGPRDLLARMLVNLAGSYRAAGRPADLEWALRMRLVIPGAPPASAIDLASAMAAQGRRLEAALELEDRARQSPHQASPFLEAARGLRADLN
jgi:regulator of sirC expression with transglutaminase-like and TPR domain